MKYYGFMLERVIGYTIKGGVDLLGLLNGYGIIEGSRLLTLFKLK